MQAAGAGSVKSWAPLAAQLSTPASSEAQCGVRQPGPTTKHKERSLEQAGNTCRRRRCSAPGACSRSSWMRCFGASLSRWMAAIFCLRTARSGASGAVLCSSCQASPPLLCSKRGYLGLLRVDRF